MWEKVSREKKLPRMLKSFWVKKWMNEWIDAELLHDIFEFETLTLKDRHVQRCNWNEPFSFHLNCLRVLCLSDTESKSQEEKLEAQIPGHLVLQVLEPASSIYSVRTTDYFCIPGTTCYLAPNDWVNEQASVLHRRLQSPLKISNLQDNFHHTFY